MFFDLNNKFILVMIAFTHFYMGCIGIITPLSLMGFNLYKNIFIL